MKTNILFIFTRTPLHVGTGSSMGVIDRPTHREHHTGFPFIPGSAVKGVVRDHMETSENEIIDTLFGKGLEHGDAKAGHISFGEARLVAFPIRSAKGSFALAVSPITLSRLARDAGWKDLEIPSPEPMKCLSGSKIKIDRQGSQGVVLEEYAFQCAGEFPTEWEFRLTQLLDDAVLSSARGRFVLLADGDLSHFAMNACQVSHHMQVDHEKGTKVDGAFFSMETVPSETLFYAPLIALRDTVAENALFDNLKTEQLIQFGGGNTTGLGFCTVKLNQESTKEN